MGGDKSYRDRGAELQGDWVIGDWLIEGGRDAVEQEAIIRVEFYPSLIQERRRDTLVCLEREDLVIVNYCHGGESGRLAGEKEECECSCHLARNFHKSNYTLLYLVQDPHIRLEITAFVLFEVHLNRIERAGNNVLPALGKLHARPSLPFGARAADRF